MKYLSKQWYLLCVGVLFFSVMFSFPVQAHEKERHEKHHEHHHEDNHKDRHEDHDRDEHHENNQLDITGISTSFKILTVDCAINPAGCSVQVDGTLGKERFKKGTFSSTATMNWLQSFPNGKGGYCAPLSGKATLVDAKNSQLFVTFNGDACDKQEGNPNGVHTFKGTFMVTGGTGKYKKSSGKGTVSGQQEGQTVTFEAKGKLR